MNPRVNPSSSEPIPFQPLDAALPDAGALLEALMATCPDRIYFKDRQSRFLRCSASVTAALGARDAAELIGRTDFDFYSAEHAQPAFDDEQEIIRTGRSIIGKVERETHPDGSVTWALTTKMAWRDASGKIVGTFGISRDITQLKQIEAELAAEKELLQVLFNELPDTIYFKDLRSRFVRVSESKVQRSLDLLREDYRREHPEHNSAACPAHLRNIETFSKWIIGKTDFDIFPHDRAQIAFDEEQRIINSGEPSLGRIEYVVLPNGAPVWMMVTKMPWRNPAGDIIGTFGLSRDITSLKEAEAKLEKLNKQLLQASHLAGMAEVATGILHNVGNVLNSVNTATSCVAGCLKTSKAVNLSKVVSLLNEHEADLGSFLSTDPKGKKIPQYLATLAEHLTNEQAAALKELRTLESGIEHIKEIVNVQQMCAKRSGTEEPVSIAELVDDALRINATSLTRHRVRVEKEVDESLCTLTEKHKPLQILVNLIRNAQQACDASGPEDRRIAIKGSLVNDRVVISVRDNGVGIAAEHLDRIFDHGFTTKKDGHGFGLHSGYLAASELGGSLRAESPGQGQGATFTLELPYRPVKK